MICSWERRDERVIDAWFRLFFVSKLFKKSNINWGATVIEVYHLFSVVVAIQRRNWKAKWISAKFSIFYWLRCCSGSSMPQQYLLHLHFVVDDTFRSHSGFWNLSIAESAFSKFRNSAHWRYRCVVILFFFSSFIWIHIGHNNDSKIRESNEECSKFMSTHLKSQLIQKLKSQLIN